MFLQGSRRWYTKYGEQRAEGLFLILFCIKSGGEIRAIVRRVRLHQCGHFMMGQVKVGSEEIPLSGTYGGDGLTKEGESFPKTWEIAVPFPEALAKEFWSGGGHNSAGSEEGPVREWVQNNLNRLRKAVRQK